MLTEQGNEIAIDFIEKLSTNLEKKFKKLNKKTNYFKQNQGINFCGYKIFSSHILVKKENIKKAKRKIKKWNKLYEQKKLQFKETTIKLNAWLGHVQNADTFNLVNNVIRTCQWIYNDKT